MAGELPSLPFPDGSFDLTLVSYFLFAYQERLTYEFHRDSILELMRVTRSEACIYPTITFEAQPSQYIPLAALRSGAPAFSIHRTKDRFWISYEFKFVSTHVAALKRRLTMAQRVGRFTRLRCYGVASLNHPED